MPLTDSTIRNAKAKEKPYKLSDGTGLYLLVNPSGSKLWRLKYKFAGKEKLLAIGAYPVVSLSEARTKSFTAKQQLADNIDPSQLKKAEKLQHRIRTENSFEHIAIEWHDNQKQRWSLKHAQQIRKRLSTDIFSSIGGRPINEITAPELLDVLRVIEARGAIAIAHRLLQTCGQIFRYAIATGRAERDVAADLKGALKTRKQCSYSYFKASELPEFLNKLEHYEGDLQTKLALKFALLTFVRTGELRGAKWEEINLDKKEWRIPAARMKMRDMHIVPLAVQTIALLAELRLISGNGEYLLPNRNKPMTCISENTMLYALYRMGYHSRATVHGFRATASTILNEHGFKPDVIEKQLAHSERNKVRASYNHAQYLLERRDMMQWWADYLDDIKKS